MPFGRQKQIFAVDAYFLVIDPVFLAEILFHNSDPNSLNLRYILFSSNVYELGPNYIKNS